MIYLSYFLAGAPIFKARLGGWPRREAPFKLGKWGMPASVLGLAWGGSMLIDFAWPRVASNPTPIETGKLVNFHWGWLNHRPVLWTVLVVIVGVGAVYYALVQRRKPIKVVAPEGELPAPVTVA